MLLRKFMRKFFCDRCGATAIIFALALIPVVGLVGAAIDYGRAQIVKNRLQDALDAAVLAAGATASMSDAERIAYAKKIFAANYPSAAMGVAAQPTITISEDGVIKGTVNGNLNTSIMGVLGIEQMDIGTTSEARIVSVLEGEIVLVLDYSWSMNPNGKYQAMRDAAIDLVDTLSERGKNDKVKFGLVPFSAAVYATLPKPYVINQSGSGDWTNCTADRRYPYNVQDTTPTNDDKTKWGCHIDEVFDEDDSKRKKGGYDNCNAFYNDCAEYSQKKVVIRSLSNNFSAVKQQLEDMRPIGNTHISLGMEFGWHVISPNAPWTEGVAYGDDKVLKAIVLLTDGDQTSYAWGKNDTFSDHNGEKNLEKLCAAIKDKGVMVLTVAFDLDDEDTKERLENCATSKSHYFDADSNASLAAAFKAITSQLVKNLHLSK